MNFTVSDTRLLDILKLLLSIPTPPPGPEAEASPLDEEIVIPETSTRDRAKMKAILEATGDEMKAVEEEDEEGEEDSKSVEDVEKDKKKAKDEINQEQIQIEVDMVLNEVRLFSVANFVPNFKYLFRWLCILRALLTALKKLIRT